MVVVGPVVQKLALLVEATRTKTDRCDMEADFDGPLRSTEVCLEP